MANRTKFDPLQSDYMPQAGDILGSGFGARAEVHSVGDGEVRYAVYYGSKFFDWRRLPVAEFAEMARRDAISVARAAEVGC